MKELEWIKEKEVLNQEVETCLTAKSAMKDKLDRARLEIHALQQYKEQSEQYRKKENERQSRKISKKPWD